MKLGSLKGRLVVVSHDLAWCADATHLAPTLQAALDDWSRIEPQLRLLATDLAHQAIPLDRFHEREALAPLPYANEGETLPPRAPIRLADAGGSCDFVAEVVVVTGKVPQDTGREEMLEKILLVGLGNRIRTTQSSTLSPVLVTPDELGDRWRGGKLHGPLKVERNGESSGGADAADMASDFGAMIADLARTGDLDAGTIIGSGAASNGGEKLNFGDRLRIWMEDEHGHAIFGAIEQDVISA